MNEHLKDLIFEKYMTKLGYHKCDMNNPMVIYLFYKKDAILCISIDDNNIVHTHGEDSGNIEACTCCYPEDVSKVYYATLYILDKQYADEYLYEKNNIKENKNGS